MKTDWINYSTSSDTGEDECLLWVVAVIARPTFLIKTEMYQGTNECLLCNNTAAMRTNETL